jgi:hypothetical protein
MQQNARNVDLDVQKAALLLARRPEQGRVLPASYRVTGQDGTAKLDTRFAGRGRIEVEVSSVRNVYTLDAFSPEDRVRSMAYIKAALNIGFALGAGLGGLALALPSNAGVHALPFVTAGVGLLGAPLILRLPRSDPHPPAAADAPKAGSVLRNRGYLAASIVSGILGTNQTLLTIVIPLWIVTQTDAPRVVLSLLFVINTALIVLLQVPASRGANTVPGALRASRKSAVFLAVSCLIILVTHSTIGWITIVLALLGYAALTGAELFAAAGQWGLQSELSEVRRRGEYQGVSRVGIAFGSLWAPALYTWLVINLHAAGWLIIGGIVLAATLCLGPSARSAQAFLPKMDTSPGSSTGNMQATKVVK